MVRTYNPAFLEWEKALSELELELLELEFQAQGEDDDDRWEGHRKTEPIRRKRSPNIPVSNPGIPGADNRLFPSQGQARKAALSWSRTLGQGYGIAHDPDPARGLPHYHVVDSQGKRVSGHFFYDKHSPHKVLRGRSRREMEWEELLKSMSIIETEYGDLESQSTNWFKTFKEPLRKQQAKDAEIKILQKLEECKGLWKRYEDLVKDDLSASGLPGVPGAKFNTDIGPYHEITLEGRERQGFSTRKLEQLKRILRERGQLMLTLPRLSDTAKRQLMKIGTNLKKQGKKVMIIVRQTQP